MTAYYFQLMFTITIRKIRAFGLHPALAALLLIISYTALLSSNLLQREYSSLIICILQLTFTLQNADIKKSEFLRLICPDRSFYTIRFLENLIINAPGIIALIVIPDVLAAFFLISISILFTFVSLRARGSRAIWSPFQTYLYEYSIGFRKSYPLYIVSAILLILSFISDNSNIALLSWFIPIILSFSYFSIKDDDILIWNHALSPRRFIFKKITQALFYLSVLNIPYISALLIHDPGSTGTILIILAVSYLGLISVILSRYASHPRAVLLPYSMLIILSILLPFLFIGLIPYFYLKSKKQLSTILS